MIRNKNNKKSEQEWIEEMSSRINIYEKLKVQSIINTTRPIDILGVSRALSVPVYKPYLNTTIDGWIEYNNSFEIYINPMYPTTRQRFTLAHEIAHYLLHKKYVMQEGQLDRGYLSKGIFNFREWQADLYASELLIPTYILSDDINQNNELFSLDKLIKHIAENFKVSIEVASKRARRAMKAIREIEDF